MKSFRENPEGEENQAATRQAEREVFAAKQPPPCACVSMDAYECARMRDRRIGDPFEEEPERRACECCCHDDYDDDYF